MNTTTRTATALVIGAVVLGGTGTAAGAEQQSSGQAGATQIVRQAERYVGDPWAKRFRTQFWRTQHIHDSWNRCHLGENAPRPRGCDGTSLTPRPRRR